MGATVPSSPLPSAPQPPNAIQSKGTSETAYGATLPEAIPTALFRRTARITLTENGLARGESARSDL